MADESVLERILINRDEKPTDLPLALLQHITNDFSQDRKIGHGGFGAVYKVHLPIYKIFKYLYSTQISPPVETDG